MLKAKDLESALHFELNSTQKLTGEKSRNVDGQCQLSLRVIATHCDWKSSVGNAMSPRVWLGKASSKGILFSHG